MAVARLPTAAGPAMQQTDVVCTENWCSREALVSIVGPTVNMVGCQRWWRSWFGTGYRAGRDDDTGVLAAKAPSLMELIT